MRRARRNRLVGTLTIRAPSLRSLALRAAGLMIDGLRRPDGRTAFVPGGASGIGAATVARLASEGAAVAVADRDGARAAKVAADVGGLGVHLDVTDRATILAGVAACEAALGPIDVLVNAAGDSRF